MDRLSLPLSSIRLAYDVVVVGSGYGAGVASSRLARAGYRVCILERGREFGLGDFPTRPGAALEEIQYDLPGARVGREDALFDFRVNDDMNVLVGCGLGGTSLINANVALRPKDEVFQHPAWPEAFRADAAKELARGYARAEAMLKPVPLPGAAPEKLKALTQSAEELGAKCVRPPITVNFTVDGKNHVGVEQRPCTSCGDCVSGCNVGAKNTVAFNYLPDAVNHGAEVFCEARVSHVERRGSRWAVGYDWIGSGRKAFDAPGLWVIADMVLLGAGALGSTEILLRSRDQGLALSSQLGKRFTGNGDYLAFAYNGDIPVNGVGVGNHPPKGLGPVGPCITGLIDLRDTDDLEDGLVIEEGSLPSPLGPIAAAPFAGAADALGTPTDLELGNVAGRLLRRAQSLLGGPYRGAMHHTQTYLVMAHDQGDGELVLADGRVRVRWPGVGDQPVFRRANETLKRATLPLRANYVRNPAWTPHLGHDLITVHPLGGCGMGEGGATGVVNHKCQVFAGDTMAVHEGLYVCDGAVIPRSLGVNPFLTISAVAERAMEMLLTDRGQAFDEHLPSVPRVPRLRRAVGIRFTETMRGYWSPDPQLDFQAAEARGRIATHRLEFTVTIEAEDIDAFLADPRHRANLGGTIEAPALSGAPLVVEGGSFELFVADPNQLGAREMRYHMPLRAENGRRYFFDGFKRIRDDRGLDLWSDTTTLFASLHEGETAQGPILGRGVLHIAPADFARQLTTIQAPGARDAPERIRAVARFGEFFAGSLFDVYGGIFAGRNDFDPHAPPRERRPLRVGPIEIHTVPTPDGKRLRLTRCRGGEKGPVMLVHGLGVSSLIFAIDTIETTLLEYLYAAGYDVWLLDFRVSIALPSAREPSTADDVARIDYPTAVAYIRRATGALSIQIVGHCYGATTFTMALLAGLEGVRAGVISQISTRIRTPALAQVKAGLHLPELLDALGINSLTAYTDAEEGWLGRLYNRALALGPVSPEERCTSAVCHRIQFMYGLLYEHGQLNEATHSALHEMFGIAHVTALEHLARMVRAGKVVDATGADVYMPHLERMQLPLLFIHGERNECFLPMSTEQTVTELSQANGAGYYTRRIIPAYGHIDCIFGQNAAQDVFPHILAHLDANP